MVILITGISSGFGEAMARQFASEGHKVYGTHRREVERIPGVEYIKVEASDEKQVESCVKQVIAAEGKIDVFINNAGMGIGGPLEFCSLEDAQHQMDVNWMGMVRFLHYIEPVLRRQGYGWLICLRSIRGHMGLPIQGLYSASKFAIEGYCEALRLELKAFNIKVIVIEPGDFSTGFTAQRKSVANSEAYEVYKSYAKSLESIEKDETGGLKPEVLAWKISKIVKDRNPRYNYVISTFEQGLSVFLKRILPPSWFAAILSSYYKL